MTRLHSLRILRSAGSLAKRLAGRFIAFGVIVAALSLFAASSHAQAPIGYVKIASTTATNYTDTAVASGDVWNYVVTATNVAGESGPSNVWTATTPITSVSHSNAITWTVSTGGAPATGYNVYRAPGGPPNAPQALMGISN